MLVIHTLHMNMELNLSLKVAKDNLQFEQTYSIHHLSFN